MGVGAFAYYRRAVENRKNDLLDQIIKVARQVGSEDELVQRLEAAKVEVQFQKALKDVKDAIPESLQLSGQNPLSLLHAALSIGLHEKSDEECLSIAHNVRLVLIELAEKIGHALKNEKELNTAVSELSKMMTKSRTTKKKRTTKS